MAKIFDIKIKNFKGINEFHHTFGKKNFICLIGRGDSGKTSILEAISLVLSPKWNIPFIDTDFHNCNIEASIEIEATLYDIPEKLLRESKFALYIRGIDFISNEVRDEIEDNLEIALSVKLVVDKTLEPKWYIVNERQVQIEINSSDRALFKMFFISDYLDKHFSWNTGSPLYSLLKNQDNSEEFDNSVILDSLRKAKETIDSASFTTFDTVIENIKSTSKELGLNINDISTTVDFKEFMLKDDKVSLHENNIPLRLKGKGTKRLLSIAIQLELLKSGGIILIDEIEQGLEPDRAQHLAKMLRETSNGQIFITTHSRDVLVELNHDNLLMLKDNNVIEFDYAFQGSLRNNPEAFFGKHLLVCEGATEVGFCRAINDYRIENTKPNMSCKGIRLVDGCGSMQEEYSKKFITAKFPVCLFCDSDELNFNSKKESLITLGITLIDCDQGKALEEQIFSDLPWEAVKKTIYYRLEESSIAQLEQSIESKINRKLEKDWIDIDLLEIRNVLGFLAKEKGWFKNITHGQVLGKICLEYLNAMNMKTIKKEIDSIMEWIDNA